MESTSSFPENNKLEISKDTNSVPKFEDIVDIKNFLNKKFFKFF